jgi:HlyD family secretion protein
MPVEVFIQTGERTPLNYLVKPISDFVTRAGREE